MFVLNQSCQTYKSINSIQSRWYFYAFNSSLSDHHGSVINSQQRLVPLEFHYGVTYAAHDDAITTQLR